MPRKTEVTIAAFSFVVNKVERQKVDPADGQPLYHGDGSPQLIDTWMIDIVEQDASGLTITHLPLIEAAKDELVRQLSGGVVVATHLPSAEMQARL